MVTDGPTRDGDEWPTADLTEQELRHIRRICERAPPMTKEYTPSTVAVDASRDNKIMTDLEDGGLDVEAVSFGGGTKRTLIENLITRLEAGEITIPASANTLTNELEVFEHEQTGSGRVRYSAPSGFHDDCVDALALAADAASVASDTGGEPSMFGYSTQ